ncbi:hypothetical protein D3C78_1337790 [compost metagenome]
MRLNQSCPGCSKETEADTGSTSLMVQGWRPNSATNQPASMAIQGSGMLQNSALSRRGDCTSLPRHSCRKAAAKSPSSTTPIPTISRKLQKSGATWGMESSTARAMAASSALPISAA